MRRSLIVIGIGLVLGVSGGIGVATTSSPSSAPPAASVPRVVPDSGQDLEASIAALQDTLRRVPADHVSWANLAVAYVEQARVSGNATFYDKADEAVARSFELEPEENFTALAASAAISAARHDFTDALASADEALAVNPRDLGALAVRVDALNELGRYDEQMEALRTADRLQPSTAVSARYSYAFELRGRPRPRRGAAAAYGRRSARARTRPTRSPSMPTSCASRAASPRPAASLAVAQEAVPDHLPALVSTARLQVAQGDLEGAVATWQEVAAPPAAAGVPHRARRAAAPPRPHRRGRRSVRGRAHHHRPALRERRGHRPRDRALRGRPRVRRARADAGAGGVGPAPERPRRRRARLGAAPQRP